MDRTKTTKWFYLLPAVGFLAIMVVFPLIWALYLSFFNWKAAAAIPPKFLGLENYWYILFKDPRFWNGLRFTLIYVGGAVSIELGLGLFLANLLSRPRIGAAFFKRLFLLPMAAPAIGLAFLWKMLLHPDSGIINAILAAFGLPGVAWTTSRSMAPITLILIDVWQWTPFMFLGLLAAIQSLPVQLYEAAYIDGAGERQAFFRITLPLLKPILATLVLFRMIDAFKVFELVWGITGGGPGTSTEALSYYIYTRGLLQFDMGYASAMSWLFLLMILLINIALLNNLRRQV